MLNGCAFVSMNKLESKLDTMIGSNIEDIFIKIGYPDLEQQFEGTTVYTWKQWTSFGGGGECVLKIQSKNHIFVNYDMYGNLDACRVLSDRLSR